MMELIGNGVTVMDENGLAGVYAGFAALLYLVQQNNGGVRIPVDELDKVFEGMAHQAFDMTVDKDEAAQEYILKVWKTDDALWG